MYRALVKGYQVRLIGEGVNMNKLDRFSHSTPERAVRGLKMAILGHVKIKSESDVKEYETRLGVEKEEAKPEEKRGNAKPEEKKGKAMPEEKKCEAAPKDDKKKLKRAPTVWVRGKGRK
jgi:hypothetical protein